MCVHADSLLRSTGTFSDSQANEGNVFWNWPEFKYFKLFHHSTTSKGDGGLCFYDRGRVCLTFLLQN